ncbi:A-agglutinin anchorage subunit-like isoform X2 [Hyalella azteca]|uniref:A-agglutinin anchorage subunit-like isoform X2 n=1 Tax=Hyalella azteca TaxID=294128 RepID=A0A8B7PG93_HYAAZ|nr:A-agglutinin anchorage subunit-like isoform X2 [Hyalella azteca]
MLLLKVYGILLMTFGVLTRPYFKNNSNISSTASHGSVETTFQPRPLPHPAGVTGDGRQPTTTVIEQNHSHASATASSPSEESRTTSTITSSPSEESRITSATASSPSEESRTSTIASSPSEESRTTSTTASSSSEKSRATRTTASSSSGESRTTSSTASSSSEESRILNAKASFSSKESRASNITLNSTSDKISSLNITISPLKYEVRPRNSIAPSVTDGSMPSNKTVTSSSSAGNQSSSISLYSNGVFGVIQSTSRNPAALLRGIINSSRNITKMPYVNQIPANSSFNPPIQSFRYPDSHTSFKNEEGSESVRAHAILHNRDGNNTRSSPYRTVPWSIRPVYSFPKGVDNVMDNRPDNSAGFRNSYISRVPSSEDKGQPHRSPPSNLETSGNPSSVPTSFEDKTMTSPNDVEPKYHHRNHPNIPTVFNTMEAITEPVTTLFYPIAGTVVSDAMNMVTPDDVALPIITLPSFDLMGIHDVLPDLDNDPPDYVDHQANRNFSYSLRDLNETNIGDTPEVTDGKPTSSTEATIFTSKPQRNATRIDNMFLTPIGPMTKEKTNMMLYLLLIVCGILIVGLIVVLVSWCRARIEVRRLDMEMRRACLQGLDHRYVARD